MVEVPEREAGGQAEGKAEEDLAVADRRRQMLWLAKRNTKE